MKVIAACLVDFEHGPLGTRARLEDDLCGETILRRTLKQLLSARRIASVHVLVHASQKQRAEAAVAGLAVQVETHNADPVPWRAYVASARKWTLDAWRGGLAGTTVFDESAHPWLLEALARREQADGVADIPPAAVLLDPHLLDAMIEHYEQVHDQVRMTFTQAPPGLAVAIYAPSLLADLAKANHWPGRMMAYNPAQPARDMIMLPCFYPPAPEVRQAVGRCIADTTSALERLGAILRTTQDIPAPDAVTVCRRLADEQSANSPALPDEVEIELTTEDPLPDTRLRPRGRAVDRRGPMDDTVFDALIDELAGRDDARIVLGGFGDPLMAPNFTRCLHKCRSAGIFARFRGPVDGPQLHAMPAQVP